MASTANTVDVQARPVLQALGRSALYRLLSLACAYPMGDGIRLQREEALPTARIGAEIAAKKLRRHLDRLAVILSSSDLEADYHRCFGHVSVPDCPSYESAYGKSGLFQQVQAMADVAGFYRAFGFVVSDAHPERVDHLAVELEFMRVLTYKEAFARQHHGRDKVAICRRAQRRFWREHLGHWLPTFARLLAVKAGSGFYGELALLLETFANTEARILGKVSQVVAERSMEQASADDMGCPLAGGEACAEP